MSRRRIFPIAGLLCLFKPKTDIIEAQRRIDMQNERLEAQRIKNETARLQYQQHESKIQGNA